MYGLTRTLCSRAVPELISIEPLNSKEVLQNHLGDKGRLNGRAKVLGDESLIPLIERRLD